MSRENYIEFSRDGLDGLGKPSYKVTRVEGNERKETGNLEDFESVAEETIRLMTGRNISYGGGVFPSGDIFNESGGNVLDYLIGIHNEAINALDFRNFK